jgi:hypothetical protein
MYLQANPEQYHFQFVELYLYQIHNILKLHTLCKSELLYQIERLVKDLFLLLN